MTFLHAPVVRPRQHPAGDPFGRLMALLTTAIIGVLLGVQYWNPNKRVIPVVVATLVFGVAWRLNMAAAMNVLVFLLPYPKGTVFGSTNLAFILIVFVIWLLRLSLRTSAPARTSPLNLPIVGLLMWYVLSFYNVKSDFALERALQNFELFASCVVLYYLIINSIRTQLDLQRLHQAQILTALGVFMVAQWELGHPQSVLIPGLLDFSSTAGNDFNLHDVRVGASFRDYELLSEYCGIMFLMALFQFARAKSTTRRVLYGLFGIFNMYTMFTTVTRGVIIALLMTLPYLLYKIRRRVNFVGLATGLLALALVVVTMNFVVANFTHSGNMFDRLLTTRVVHGVVPEARQAPWLNAWKRALVHPLIGGGPYYDEIPGYEFWWPHNVYLFVANLVGFPGLGFFLMFLIGLIMLLRPTVDDLNHESYADAYLVIARTQLFMFMLNELKIDYLRNAIYQFQVWQLFGTWTAAYLVSRSEGVLSPGHRSAPETPPEHRLAA